VSRGRLFETEAGVCYEIAEVAVSCQQRNSVVNARLRYQCICQMRLETSTQKARTKLAGALPIAIEDFESGDAANQLLDVVARKRIAEQFCDNHWRKNALAKPQSSRDGGDVAATLAGQESNHRAGV
jgi:hypothetical protein